MGPDASLTPELIQAQAFTNGFRGYDAAEVRAFLTRVANELRAWRERAEGLESAWHSAEERAARPPVLDEDTLMAAVGEETAAILRTARAAAADMRTKATEETERLLAEAGATAERTVSEAAAEAGKVLTDARDEAARLRAEAEAAVAAAAEATREEANALLEAARRDAAELLQRAAAEAGESRAKAEKDRQLTIEGANSTRDRILEDLSRRRRVATVQIEQLRAGRERLIESYAIVRRTLEEVQSELSRADAEARAAADEVGRRLKDEAEVELTEASRAMTEPVPAAEPDGGAVPAPEGPAALEDAGTDAGAADTHVSDSEVADTDVADTDVADPDVADPDVADTDVADTDVAGADAADSDAADSDAADSDVADSDAAGSDAEDSASAVDQLFARIRGTRPGDAPDDGEEHAEPAADHGPAEPEAAQDPVAEAQEPIGGEATGRKGRRRAPAATTNGHDNGHDHGHEATPSRARSTVRVIEPTASAADPADDPADDPAGEHTDEPAVEEVADGDEALLQARELWVVDLEVNLTRRLKRALQDEQNDVLDRLRNLKEAPTAERVLPEEVAQIARYSGAARPLLADAASAGAVFTDERLGLPGRDAPVDVEVADLAEECGSGIVSALRRRLEQAVQIGAGDDQAVLVESLGAAYREWKTQRIERLAGDVLSAAFSRGTWQAAPLGARFRWVVDDVDGPCPDCDDDALAGEIPKGDEFPTGQAYPPAHSGCRCLLVPAI